MAKGCFVHRDERTGIYKDFIHPHDECGKGDGLNNALSFYKYISWLYPIVHPLFPNSFGTLREVGLAMVNSVLFSPEKKVLNTKDIAELAGKG